MKTNWAAVIVAAVAYWLLGALWFGKLFSEMWIAGTHMSPVQIAEMGKEQGMGPHIIALLGNLIITIVIAKVIAASGQWTASGGARVGVVLGFGIAFTAMATEMAFEAKPL